MNIKKKNSHACALTREQPIKQALSVVVAARPGRVERRPDFSVVHRRRLLLRDLRLEERRLVVGVAVEAVVRLAARVEQRKQVRPQIWQSPFKVNTNTITFY